MATNALDVTDEDSGLLLSAVQNNAAVPGSLRSEVEKAKHFGQDVYLAVLAKDVFLDSVLNFEGHIERCGYVSHLKLIIQFPELSDHTTFCTVPQGYRPRFFERAVFPKISVPGEYVDIAFNPDGTLVNVEPIQYGNYAIINFTYVSELY